MHYTTLLSPEQQAFETVRAALEWMGVGSISLLCAECVPHSVNLTIILSAASYLDACDILNNAFCDDVRYGDVEIVLSSTGYLMGFYQVVVSVPEEVQ